MRHVAAGVAEADARQHAGEHQGLADRDVARRLDARDQVLADQPDRLHAGDVAVGIGALVERPRGRVLRRLALGVGPRGERLDRMREDVEAVCRDHGGRQRRHVRRVEHAQRRPQVAVRDAGLQLLLDQVEDRDASAFARRAEGGGAGDMRLQRAWNRPRFADRGVDVGQEIGGIGGIEVGGFRGVDGRAAAERDEAVEFAVPGEIRRRLEGAVGRLDLDGVIDRHVDPGAASDLARGLQRRQLGDARVAEQRHALQPQRPGVGADLAQARPRRT